MTLTVMLDNVLNSVVRIHINKSQQNVLRCLDFVKKCFNYKDRNNLPPEPLQVFLHLR